MRIKKRKRERIIFCECDHRRSIHRGGGCMSKYQSKRDLEKYGQYCDCKLYKEVIIIYARVFQTNGN